MNDGTAFSHADPHSARGENTTYYRHEDSNRHGQTRNEQNVGYPRRLRHDDVTYHDASMYSARQHYDSTRHGEAQTDPYRRDDAHSSWNDHEGRHEDHYQAYNHYVGRNERVDTQDCRSNGVEREDLYENERYEYNYLEERHNNDGNVTHGRGMRRRRANGSDMMHHDTLPTSFGSRKEHRVGGGGVSRGGVSKTKRPGSGGGGGALAKYESQRHRLFHRFDEGIQMDAVSWYSVTPEKIAAHIARRFCAALPEGATVVDAFCGAGGNAIQFAAHGLWVLAVELVASRVHIARHNATVYGVEDGLDVVHGNAYHVLPALRRVDAVFLSPPWGGPSYADVPFDLAVFQRIITLAKQVSHNVAILVPRNIDCDQARQLFGRCEIEYNYLGAPPKLKTVTIYFGELAKNCNSGAPGGSESAEGDGE